MDRRLHLATIVSIIDVFYHNPCCSIKGERAEGRRRGDVRAFRDLRDGRQARYAIRICALCVLPFAPFALKAHLPISTSNHRDCVSRLKTKVALNGLAAFDGADDE